MRINAQHNIKTYWFDMGNVIIPFDFTEAIEVLAKNSKVSEESIHKFLKHNEWLEHDLDEGKVTGRKLFEIFDSEFIFKPKFSYEEFKFIWNNIFTENRVTIELIHSLKKANKRLLLVSNTNKMHFDHIVDNYSFVEAFDKHILSYELKTRKPLNAMFDHAMNHSSADPHEIYYTDDREDLTSAAKKNYSIHVHTFRTELGLIEDLTKRGAIAG